MDEKLVRFNMPAEKLDWICWILLLGPALLYVILNITFSGPGPFWESIKSVHSLYSLPVLITIYIAHEALHVLGGILVGLRISDFSFRFDKRTLSIECSCNEKMTLKAYHFMLLLPFLVLTPLLLILGYTYESHLWWTMLVLSVSGCAFDLTVFIGLLGVPGDVKIIPELEGKNGYLYMKGAA